MSYSFVNKRIYMNPTPIHTFQTHTLSNGLTLIMGPNKLEPRIYTHIVVKAGAKNDPPGLAGLAHYMEHMLFKGSDKIGTLDWERESALLAEISDLFEQHRHTEDPDQKKAIYAQIDQLSLEAASFVASNEYDKLLSAIGARGTNAYTGYDQTVYINDIPSNELERWMQLESERFSYMALRLFHTELETVYEEFNMTQVNDHRKATAALRTLLFPDHPYGTQTVIGPAEQLKNPSQQKIQEFFGQFYRPNNMGIILSGDFDPQEVIALAEKYFGPYQAAEIPHGPEITHPELPTNQSLEVLGQESPFVYIAWKIHGDAKTTLRWLLLLENILQNDETGLLDIHLNRQQKVLQANAWTWNFQDYSAIGLFGMPKQDQTLEEVRELLQEQINLLCRGEFESWLPQALARNFKLHQQHILTSNRDRVNILTSYFLQGLTWKDYLDTAEWLMQLDKATIIQYAQQHLGQPQAIVYKHQGEDPGIVRVSQPPITPVPIQNEQYSDFAQQFLAQPETRLQPVFVDFDEWINTHPLDNGVSIKQTKNQTNELFTLEFVFELGKNHDPELRIASRYLEYLGTDRFSATAVAQEFYKLGLGYEFHVDAERTAIALNGLEESLEKGLELLHHYLFFLQADELAYENLVSDILTRRENSKQDRNVVLKHALANYAKYGSNSPFTNLLSTDELYAIQPEQLMAKIGGLFQYPFQVLFYGKQPAEKLSRLLRPFTAKAGTRPMPQPRRFPTHTLDRNELFFLDFPIVQNEILMLGKSTDAFDLEAYKARPLYNSYFGSGLSSIVFQEIRESKGLAYSSYAYFGAPHKKEDPHYLSAYVGTQPDKVATAIPALSHILRNMPVNPEQINQARQSLLKLVESERIAPDKILGEYLDAQAMGFDHDYRRYMYEWLSSPDIMSPLLQFHETYIREKPLRFMVMGDRKTTNMAYLESLGTINTVTLEEIFGY